MFITSWAFERYAALYILLEKKTIYELFSFLLDLLHRLQRVNPFLAQGNQPPRSSHFSQNKSNKCTHGRKGAHWPIWMKFEIQALHCQLFHIYLKLADTRIMRSVSISSKLRLILKVSLDRVDHFYPGFSWFPDAIRCNLTCFSIFRIDESSLLDNHDFLSHLQAIFRAEI